MLCSRVSWQRSMMIHVSPHVTGQLFLTPIILFWVASLVTLMGSDQVGNLILFDLIRLTVQNRQDITPCGP